MLRILIMLSFICRLDLLNARPAEEPTRFILSNGQSNAENVLPSRLEQAKELLEGVIDAITIGRGRFVNSIILAKNIVADRAEQLNSEIQNNLDSIIIKSDKPNQSPGFLVTVRTTTPINLIKPIRQETIRLENETAQAILEKRKPDNIRQILDRYLKPIPIVDKITEEEKYGNTGDRFLGVGQAIVNGYANFSNLLNNIVDFPADVLKQTSRGITQMLNQLGARIIGLQ